MRLWHQKLIPYLDRQRILSQHRECCALRGLGWGRKHATVNYVFKYSPDYLIAYHQLIRNEMLRRDYKYNLLWDNPNYRGQRIGYDNWADPEKVNNIVGQGLVFKEHDSQYLIECLNNLKEKGFDLFWILNH